jgi:parvulin-like peptidyl-prolyl isomerase
VEWSRLRPILNELAGGQALQEVVLDLLLEEELREANIVIGSAEIARERRVLQESLSPDPDLAFRLLDNLRSQRRLGEVRFEALLRRNAGLRMLVQDQANVTTAAVRRHYELIHGEKRQARLIVAPTLADAQAALKRITLGERFGDVAVEVSTDASAARGGLLEPIAPGDPAYSASLHEAIGRLNVGQTSQPILLDSKYILLRLERIVPPDDVPFELVETDLRELTRRNQERLLMERQARALLSSATVLFFDETLREGFRNSDGSMLP